jgi:hypothetical protein
MLSATRTAAIAGAFALVLLAILPLIETIVNRGHVFGSDETS